MTTLTQVKTRWEQIPKDASPNYNHACIDRWYASVERLIQHEKIVPGGEKLDMLRSQR